MAAFAPYLSGEQQEELASTAQSLVVSGKGILAADESLVNIGKKFASVGKENNENNRRLYRQLLFTSGPGLAQHISGVILSHETFYHKTDDGIGFVDLLKKQGIAPGIKVDTGLVPLAGTHNETTTQGLDELASRCAQYKSDGAMFAKWRCALRVGRNTPSHLALTENANVLARYATVCQQNGLVPIVEPEVLSEGDHVLEEGQRVTELALAYTYKALADHHVFLEGTLLKPNMATAGNDCSVTYTTEQVAKATVRALLRSVPAAVPGICFLSGGQSENHSTLRLNAMNRLSVQRPWALTFSYGRALQASVVQAWEGKEQNVRQAQQQLLIRAKVCGEAAQGKCALQEELKG